MGRADSLEKTLMLGKIEQNGGAEDETESTTDSMDMNLSKFLERVEDRRVCCATVHGVAKSQT